MDDDTPHNYSNTFGKRKRCSKSQKSQTKSRERSVMPSGVQVETYLPPPPLASSEATAEHFFRFLRAPQAPGTSIFDGQIGQGQAEHSSVSRTSNNAIEPRSHYASMGDRLEPANDRNLRNAYYMSLTEDQRLGRQSSLVASAKLPPSSNILQPIGRQELHLANGEDMMASPAANPLDSQCLLELAVQGLQDSYTEFMTNVREATAILESKTSQQLSLESTYHPQYGQISGFAVNANDATPTTESDLQDYLVVPCRARGMPKSHNAKVSKLTRTVWKGIGRFQIFVVPFCDHHSD